MNTANLRSIEATAREDLPLQAASMDIWERKYRLTDKSGNPVDHDIEAMFGRVAKATARVERPALRKHWEERFLWALQSGAIPAGRILANVGAGDLKPATSTINCTVSETIADSMKGILDRVHDAGLTLRAGCGIGYEFSTLRPKGAYVSGAGATTSGPLSFMDIYDKMCFTISSAGGRRGAQMATFDVGHPDIMHFIRAKREDGRLRQFNLSVLITDEFIKAVKSDEMWDLAFPAFDHELAEDDCEFVWREWPIHHEKYTVRGDGKVACKVYRTVKARRLWDLIMNSTYEYADPGFILIDAVNEMNNNWFCETIRASNPCGEQMLPPFGSCLLGSVNLTRFVVDPYTDQARFDFDLFEEVVGVFTRMLDNVVELNGLPLDGQVEEILAKRRHGMGYLGLGSAMTMLGMTYGSEKSVQFTEDVSRILALTGWRVGVELAKEKGCAPIFKKQLEVTPEMMSKRPEMAREGIKVGDLVSVKILHARYSRYMQKIAEADPEIIKGIEQYGCRFTHHTSIAPTGTIALSLGNNASNGIEPSFAHQYSRNIIREGKKSKEKVDVLSYELMMYRALVDAKASAYPDPSKGETPLPDYFIAADTITPQAHVDVQAAAQKWVDASISKTINVPTDIDYGDFKDVYMYAYDKGLKGCTTFRFNPAVHQGVLVRNEDLANTKYSFSLEDGTTVTLKGDEQVWYDGEVHTAANLFDALTGGYYGHY